MQIKWQIGGTPNLKGAYVIQPQNNSTIVLGYHEIPDYCPVALNFLNI
jgi:hypothetical protein